MDYRSDLQESLDYYDDGYRLKTNEEIIDIICDFGCGETEFHTADIERLIKENSKMVDVFKKIIGSLNNEKDIKLVSKIIKLYE